MISFGVTERDIAKFDELAADMVNGIRDARARIDELEEEVEKQAETIADLREQLTDALNEARRG